MYYQQHLLAAHESYPDLECASLSAVSDIATRKARSLVLR